jgi:hypothetical protein
LFGGEFPYNYPEDIYCENFNLINSFECSEDLEYGDIKNSDLNFYYGDTNDVDFEIDKSEPNDVEDSEDIAYFDNYYNYNYYEYGEDIENYSLIDLDGGIYNYNSKISKLNYSFEDFFFL